MGRESFGTDDVARQALRGGENGMYEGDDVHTASQRNLADKILENSGLELTLDVLNPAPYQPTAEGVKSLDTNLAQEQIQTADKILSTGERLETEAEAYARESEEIRQKITALRQGKK